MIPKKIHYCWFGRGEKPKLAQKCIASWKKFCPDYEIIEWNEDNFDLNENAYVRYCYENKKWAFLSDYVRLAVVCREGGIYFDTDVELIAPMDALLEHEAFYAFENDNYVATGLGFGAEANHVTIQKMVAEYAPFSPKSGETFNFIGCPTLNTNALIPLGLKRNGAYQTVAGAVILPQDYMNPYEDATGRLNKTANTVSIHWYSKSALPKSAIVISNITRVFHRLFGVNCFDFLKK